MLSQWNYQPYAPVKYWWSSTRAECDSLVCILFSPFPIAEILQKKKNARMENLFEWSNHTSWEYKLLWNRSRDKMCRWLRSFCCPCILYLISHTPTPEFSSTLHYWVKPHDNCVLGWQLACHLLAVVTFFSPIIFFYFVICIDVYGWCHYEQSILLRVYVATSTWL